MRRFTAAALVDGDIYKYRAILHLREILLLKELRGGATGDQYGTDNEVRVFYDTLDIRVIAYESLDMRTEHVIELFESSEVDVEDRDIGSHTDSDLAGVHADRTAAEDHDIGLRGSGNTGEKDTFTAELLL